MDNAGDLGEVGIEMDDTEDVVAHESMLCEGFGVEEVGGSVRAPMGFQELRPGEAPAVGVVCGHPGTCQRD